MIERLEDVRVSLHCLPYCILVSYNAGEETQRKTTKYLVRKGTVVLKEGESEWSADRSAASVRERWKDLCKPSASAGRKKFYQWKKKSLVSAGARSLVTKLTGLPRHLEIPSLGGYFITRCNK